MKNNGLKKLEREATQLEHEAAREIKAIEHGVEHEVKVLERKTRNFDSFWYLVLFAIGYFIGAGMTWLYFRPETVTIPLFVDSMVPKMENLGLTAGVINYQRIYLSRDKNYLRVPVNAGPINYYPLDNEIMPGGFSPAHNEAYYWVDLRQVSLPVNKMTDAVTDGNGQIAYISSDGRGYLYDTKSSSLTLLPEELNFDASGCRPGLGGFSPGGRFLSFASVGESETCPDYGVYDIKSQKLLSEGAGNHEQSYAFYSKGEAESYLIRFSAWTTAGEPISTEVGDKVSIYNVDTGESKVLKDGLNGSVFKLIVRRNDLLGVSPEGEEKVIVSDLSQYLP